MPRCVRCHREIKETVHRGDAYRIDGFRLHTGKVRRASTAGDDGEPHHYFQLYEAVDVFLCVDCFRERADVWLHHFPASDEVEPLTR